MENPSTPLTTETNPTPIHSTHPKPLLYFFLVIVLLLVGLGGFVLGKFYTENKTEEPIDETLPIVQKPKALPSTNSTADWETYTNDKSGLSFKYPSEMKFQPTSEGCGPVFFYPNTEKIWITVCGPYLNEKNANDFAKKSIDRNGTKLASREESLIGGEKAIKLEIKESTNQYSIEVYIDDISYTALNANNITSNEKAPIVVYLYIQNLSQKEQSIAIFNQILSTFRFLDQNTSSMTNWQTCNDSRGFTMEYPLGFEMNTGSCNYSIQDYSLVQNIKVTDPTKDLQKNWLITVDVEKSDLNPNQWIIANKCTNNQLCSEIKPGPIPYSSTFDISAHYTESNVVTKIGDKIVIFSLNARNPDSPVSNDIRNIFDQILSTFKFTE